MLSSEQKEQINLNRQHSKKDWTSEEKQKLIFYEKLNSFFQLLLSIGLFITGIFFEEFYPCLSNILLVIIGFSAILYSLVVIYWIFTHSSELEKNTLVLNNSPQKSQRAEVQVNEDGYEISDKKIHRFILFVSIFLLIAIIVDTISVIIYKDTVLYYFQANQSLKETKVSNGEYDKVLISLKVFAALNVLSIGYTIFVAYVFCKNFKSFRFILLFFSFITLFCCGALLYMCTSAYYFQEINALNKIADYSLANTLFYLSIAFMFLIFCLIIINGLQSKFAFFTFATFLLVLTLLLITYSGNVYRNAQEINRQINQNCQNPMQLLHEDSLIKSGCKEKYLYKSLNQIYPDCPKEQQAIQWEKDEGLFNTKKSNEVGCLNFKCCGLAGKVYADYFYLIACLGIIITLLSFIVVGAAYYLSEANSDSHIFDNNSKTQIIIIFVALMIVLFWVLLTVFSLQTPVRQNPGILTKIKKLPQTETPQNNYNLEDVVVQLKCSKLFDQYYEIIYAKKFSELEEFKPQNENNPIRITIKLSFFKLQINNTFNKNIKVFDSRYASAFGESLKPDQQFIAVEGLPQQVYDFLNNDLCISPYNENEKHELQVKIEKVSQNNPQKKKKQEKIKNQPLSMQQQNENETWVNNANQLSQQIQFQTVHIKVLDYETNAPLNSQVTLSLYEDHRLCLIQTAEPYLKLTGTQEVFQINNLYVKTYTLFAKAENYNHSCVEINQMNNQVIVYMHKKLVSKNQMKIVLQWNNQRTLSDLDLFLVFKENDKKECIVSFLNKNCQGVLFEEQFVKKNVQTIKVNKYGANNYLVFVKQNISQQKFKQYQEIGKKDINNLLLQSDAKVFVYTKEFDYPAFQSNLLSIQDQDDMDEINLAWLVGCFSAEVGNKMFEMNKLWILYSEYSYVYKKDNQYMPSADICTKFLDYLKKNKKIQ